MQVEYIVTAGAILPGEFNSDCHSGWYFWRCKANPTQIIQTNQAIHGIYSGVAAVYDVRKGAYSAFMLRHVIDFDQGYLEPSLSKCGNMS